MKKPSKKEIKAAVDKLKDAPTGGSRAPETHVEKQLSPQKSSMRIRKQGV